MSFNIAEIIKSGLEAGVPVADIDSLVAKAEEEFWREREISGVYEVAQAGDRYRSAHKYTKSSCPKLGKSKPML